jgi:hypothetical protein
LTKLQLTGSYAIAFIGALLIGTGLLQLHARQRVGTRNRSLSRWMPSSLGSCKAWQYSPASVAQA